MTTFNRRSFLKYTGFGAAAVASAMALPRNARAAGGRVVIVGGGIGGATTAHYLRRIAPEIDVTLVEPKSSYHTCFMSNEVLAGDRPLSSIEVGYDALKAMGVNVVQDMATAIDPEKKEVRLKGGDTLAYDRCVVSPGIDFKWDAIEGYGPDATEHMPHSWQAGPQTRLLRSQLEAMEDGGTFILVPPPNPFRCPPGPYERASLVSKYFTQNKPRSKVLILDPKDGFSKQGLFTQAWEKFYGFGTDNSMIEWIPRGQNGMVRSVKPAEMTVATDFETFKGAVVNVIPAQKAGRIAFQADLTDGDWCPVDKLTFESTRHADIHVLGDASMAAKMPKSGYSANSQGKVCAAAIAALMKGETPPQPSYVNTCYSIGGEDWAFSVAAVYTLEGDTITPVEGAGGLSPMDASPRERMQEVHYAHSWFRNIKADTFGI